MANVYQNLSFYKDGDTYCIALTGDFAVKNNGPGIASNVVLTITVPSGLDIAAGMSAVDRGTFDEGTATWTIGSMVAGETVDASFCFEITDDCLGPYSVQMDITHDACDCTLENNSICYILDGVSCCDIQGCTIVVDNIYTTDGTQADPLRTWDGGGNALSMQSFSNVSIQGTGDLALNFDTDMEVAVSGTISLDSGGADYILLTAPPENTAGTKGLVRNVSTGALELITVSHGAYADDTAAGGGSVPVGGHYYNTTTGVMHTRMT